MLCKPVRSPKRDTLSRKEASENLYDYYAGFSQNFVIDIIKGLNIEDDAVIMDPWNGSGTTTKVAKDMRFSAIGLDINPVMVIVAKAKLLNCTKDFKNKIVNYIDLIIKTATIFKDEVFNFEEPLCSWLQYDSALHFRKLERAIHLLLVSDEYHTIYTQESLSSISNLAAFFYLALFKTLRSFLVRYVSTNPTWIKMASAKRENISPSSAEIFTELKNQVNEMVNIILSDNDIIYDHDSSPITIKRASSELIPLPDSSIDLVISSPPYCTRIDYAIATSPELALLGCSMNKDLKNLRDSMIGTPTIIKKTHEAESNWGPTCRSFLNSVEVHNSKASKSYYYRCYVQYFNSIYKSLLEIDRVLVESAKCVIVVQDSYYKNIHNDLPSILTEMAELVDWSVVDRLNFDIKKTMANCNRETKKYRSNLSATESVLLFKK